MKSSTVQRGGGITLGCSFHSLYFFLNGSGFKFLDFDRFKETFFNFYPYFEGICLSVQGVLGLMFNVYISEFTYSVSHF